MKKKLIQKGQSIYSSLNQRTSGALDKLKTAGQKFGQKNGTQAAAGMAYYTLFSLFPFLIVVVTIASFFVRAPRAVDQISDVMKSVIPVSQNFVQNNIERILEIRGSTGFLGLLGLLWSGSNAFSMLVQNVNQAWTEAEQRSFIKKRALALGIVAVILGLLILLMFSSSILGAIPQVQIPGVGTIAVLDTKFWSWTANLSPWLFSFIFFISLYRWIPTAGVSWPAAAWSALLATPLWRLASMGFSWYLRSGLPNYDLIYGSLSTIIVLLLWIYISSVIIFFGAHVCAALEN